MTSLVAWLDYSDAERRKVLDVIQRFADRDTRDELGIGSVRDGFADRFFPGTSTIQTRARYFLLIPWIYLEVERRHSRHSGIADKARDAELKLIDALAEGGDTAGLIGKDARRTLKRLPSEVYWQGLAIWGTRLFPGSRERYHREIELGVFPAAPVRAEESGELVDDALRAWHPHLPDPPDGFPWAASLALAREDAEYLTERILARAADTVLAKLVSRSGDWEQVPFVWEYPGVEDLPAKMRGEIDHARRFSEVMHGSALLYNLLLAEKRKDDALRDAYRLQLADWVSEIRAQQADLARWNRDELWDVVARTPAQVNPRARRFITRWLELALDGDVPAESDPARKLITQREVEVKGGLARLRNTRALEMWGGAAGTARLDYRWGIAQTHLLEILRARALAADDAGP